MAKARRWTHPQKKVGKEPLWGSPFTLDSSLGLHSSLSRLKKKERTIAHLLLASISIRREPACACGHTPAPLLEEEGRSQVHF